jgi:cysteine desulfurase
MNRIYLDYAAATPIDPHVLETMHPYFSDAFYNPSEIYLSARKVKRDINQARAKIAMWLGARHFEIYFMAGATEANNLAIQGVMKQFPGSQLLVSMIEHESVLAPAGLFDRRLIPVTPKGIIDLKAAEKLVTPETVLISVMMVNNELGTVQPVKELAALVKSIRRSRRGAKNSRPLYLHTDAAQAGNLFDLHTHRLGVDMMSLNGGKIYGPKQTGALFVKTDVELKPLIVGGGQEGNLRSGTQNVAGAIGLSKALDMAQKQQAKEYKRLADLRDFMIRELSEKVPAAIINGSGKNQSPHLVSATFPGKDNERLMMGLDEAGIMCAVGSACSASQDESSHVLSAIGLSEASARSTLRFSLGRATSRTDITKTVRELARLTASNR